MKISKLIEILQPHSDCESDLEVEFYDTGTGDEEIKEVNGVRIELGDEGQPCRVVILS